MPSIDVVMPVYRGRRFLAEAIESLNAQTVDDWAVTVVDDACPDATGELAQALAPDASVIRLASQGGRGRRPRGWHRDGNRAAGGAPRPGRSLASREAGPPDRGTTDPPPGWGMSHRRSRGRRGRCAALVPRHQRASAARLGRKHDGNTSNDRRREAGRRRTRRRLAIRYARQLSPREVARYVVRG